MTKTPPLRDPLATTGSPIPPPEPADYTDELSAEQLDVLREVVTQDESKMGPLVHEFTW